VIENSAIHDCGKLPAQNGDHGIYVAHAVDTIIRDNWIYDNADRGIQLYPDSQGTQVYGNVIDGNGEGVIFSGNGQTASSDNVVHDNVISNSRVRWNVESYWDGPIGTGNVVRDNCLWASNATGQASYYNSNGGILPGDAGGDGFSTSGNVIANPRFVDPASRNLQLQPDSPCLGPPRLVTLTPETKQVEAGSRVRLHGHVRPVKHKQVTIQIIRHGHWRTFGRTTVKPNGKFSLRRRLSTRGVAHQARLRAKVPRVGRSKPIAIRVRS
jgi:parallel beta-helix repeat protein